MIALRLVRLIEDHADELAETLLQKFRSSPHLRSLRFVEDEECAPAASKSTAT